MAEVKPLTEQQLRSPAYGSTGTAMEAKGRYEACADTENAIAQALDILIVARKALCGDKGGLIEEDKDAVLTVVSIAEEKVRAALAEAKRATELTGWPGP